jgi:hypothetical protein
MDRRARKLHEYARTRTKKQIVEDWPAPIPQLLACHTIGRLVLDGDSARKPALNAGSGAVASLLDFRGKRRVGRVCKAGAWPTRSDKLFAAVKTALESEDDEETVTMALKPKMSSVSRETRGMKRKGEAEKNE